MKCLKFSVSRFISILIVLVSLPPLALNASWLQEMIDAASPGSTLNIPPGTNFGPIVINKDLTLNGAGAGLTFLHGGHTNRVVTVNSNIKVYLGGLTITGGDISHEFAHGSGLQNYGQLEMNGCRIEQNKNLMGSGGGIANFANASLVMSYCIVVSNWANGTGGGIYNNGNLRMVGCPIEKNGSGGGGGIASPAGSLTLEGCGIRYNSVDDGRGGGILAGSSSALLTGCSVVGNIAAFYRETGGGIYGGNPLVLNNCTISGNRTADGVGGGLCGEAIRLNHCTITRNVGSAGTDVSGGGGIYGTVLESQNTILAGNSLLAGGNDAPDCKGSIHSLGYNLIGNSSGCAITAAAGDQIGTATAPIDPKLYPLSYYNNMEVHEPSLDSPAVDRGSIGGLVSDQRGVSRPVDILSIPNASDGSDIGAVERAYQFNSELQALIDHATEGSILQIPAGTIHGFAEIYKNLILQGAGPGLTILDGGRTNSVLFIRPGVTVTVNDMTITRGQDAGNISPWFPPSWWNYGGGCIKNAGNLTMNRCWIQEGLSEAGGVGAGGGICCRSASASTPAALVLNDCVIRNNGTGGDGPSGGGIASDSPVTLNNCTVAANFSGVEGVGGGIVGGKPLRLNNCTVSGNEARGGAGGGIYSAWPIYLNHSTITQNKAGYGFYKVGGGGIYGDVTECRNTIIAGNTSGADGPDCKGSIKSLGYNLVGDASRCVFTAASGDQVGTASAPLDPKLGPLQNNGGFTDTHILLPGSPAIDKGSSGGLSKDQRGLARPYDFAVISNVQDGSDIGSVEMQAGDPVAFSNSASVTIPDHGPAAPYPSTLVVQNLSGTVEKVTVTLLGLRHTYPADLGVLLVSPTGKAVLIMAAAGGGYDLNNITLTFDDAATGYLPQSTLINSGIYKPTGYNLNFPFAAPAPATWPYSTALSSLRGLDPNGTWALYLFDSASGDQGSLQQGWSLRLTTRANTAPTISPTPLPDQVTAINTASSLLVFTVSDPDTDLSALTISAVSENQVLLPNANLLLGGIGAQRTLLLLPAVGQTGTARIRLAVSDGVNTTTQSFVVTVSGSADFSQTAWNTKAIAIPAQGAATPYPSTLTLLNLNGTIQKAIVTLHGLSHTWPADVRVLLAGPAGQKVLVTAKAGYNKPLNQVTLQLDDSAPLALPQSTEITSGIYKPASYVSSGSFPAPAPAAPYATALSALNGTSPNGAWSLYVWDDSAYDQGSLLQGWGLTLFTQAAAGPQISPIADQATPRNTATPPLLFTVSDTEVTPDKITLTAQSSNPTLAPAANLILGGSGANRTLVIIPAPNQTGSATVTLSASNGKATTARAFALNVTPTTPESRSWFNFAPVTLRDNSTALPYPSTITVSGLAGTVGQVTVTLLGLSHSWPEDISLVLVSPTGQKSWLMGHAGRNKRLDNLALQFNDAAPASLPLLGPIVSGTFKPSSYTTRTLPAPAPAGPYATNLAVFKSQAPNGTWALFATDDNALDQGQIAQGWGLTLTLATAGPQQIQPGQAQVRVPAGAQLPTTNPEGTFWLEAVGLLPGGQVHLRLHGQAGQRYLLQASSDQRHWQDLQEVTAASDIVELEDQEAATQRFYRVKRIFPNRVTPIREE